MGNHATTQCPGTFQELVVQRGPKGRMGEQRPMGLGEYGQGIMSNDRELGLCPGACGKLSKSFKQGSTVIVECLESSGYWVENKLREGKAGGQGVHQEVITRE